MDNTQLLAQLRDIHLPRAISNGPFACGWILLFCFLGIGVLFVIRVALRFYRENALKRQALTLLENYRQEYQRSEDAMTSSMKISELLRRVALSYYPRHQVANLSQDAWILFLNQNSSVDFTPIKHMLLEWPYHPTKAQNLDALFSCANKWIKERRRSCLN